MNFYKRALELEKELTENRRYIHKNAEAGMDMPKTCAFIREKLQSYGLEPMDCGRGISAAIGSGKPCILLRADMDALPIPEETGLDFASEGEVFHGCGHDMHAAMLLTAAKMLKEAESELNGQVKILFQPGEEILEGAAEMLANGIMDGVDTAFGIHVGAGKMLPGTVLYNDSNAMMASSDGFRIHITGRGAHGGYPWQAIDPINIACHIHLALQELIARECNPSDGCLLTIGQLSAGDSWNIIPDKAMMAGSMRSRSKEARQLLFRRIEEVARNTAAAFGGKAEIEMMAGAPPLICDKELTGKMISYIKELDIPNLNFYNGIQATAADDFALYANEVPGCYLYLTAGFKDERGEAPAHNPKVMFNEAVLPMGAAVLAQGAKEWLAKRK